MWVILVARVIITLLELELDKARRNRAMMNGQRVMINNAHPGVVAYGRSGLAATPLGNCRAVRQIESEDDDDDHDDDDDDR